ncbi:hypothetical protein POVCU2_0048790 [Plasmodium ovale curtisi]|uniref:Uncharacterized protein n=1 Tax=Plasmodium ovale curtisi TaxID=864141 RepID=A0A1A8W6R0_PLAOA|nr:hypothetical protein POVCU2_0048790 [Plasmodium ovale curtisi]SBS98320.1 hypothetical protein POVCU1_045230 [Plasmodium ovale curtisi]
MASSCKKRSFKGSAKNTQKKKKKGGGVGRKGSTQLNLHELQSAENFRPLLCSHTCIHLKYKMYTRACGSSISINPYPSIPPRISRGKSNHLPA